MGASPIDSSSSSSTAGSVPSARDSASICCSPPDSVPASWCAALAEDREPGVGHLLEVGQRAPVPVADPEVLAHREVGEDAAALGDGAHARGGPAPRAVMPVDRCGRRAAARPPCRVQPAAHPHRGGLAAAVRPEQRHHRARAARARSTPWSTSIAPYAGADADQLQQRPVSSAPWRTSAAAARNAHADLLGADVGVDDRRDSLRPAAGSRGDERAVVEDVDRGAHAHDQRQVVLDEADREPVLGEAGAAAPRTPAVSCSVWPDAGSSSSRTRGAGHQRARQLHHPRPSGGDVGDVAVGDVREPGRARGSGRSPRRGRGACARCRCRMSPATRTLSRTVSDRNSSSRWNVRAMPSRARWPGPAAVMSRPSRTTRPDAGASNPVMHVEQRGLARAVRADQPGDRPSLHREATSSSARCCRRSGRDAAGLEQGIDRLCGPPLGARRARRSRTRDPRLGPGGRAGRAPAVEPRPRLVV